MFIRFPAILLVKTIDSYLHEFCARGILQAIFSNMAQRQKTCYRVARYVIVNNATTAMLESKSKNAWKRHWQKRNGNSLNSLYLGVSNSFKDGSSKLNNHSAMAIGKFILALSIQFEFCFILWLFALRFCMKMIWNQIIRFDSWLFSFPWGMNEKNQRAHCMAGVAIRKCARRCFHSYLKETKKINNQFLNDLIFFMLIRFPAFYFLKQLIHISMNCARGIVHSDFQ